MASTSVRIMCPSLTCRKILAVPTSARGKTVRCKSCGTCIRVPDAPPTASSASHQPTPTNASHQKSET